MSHLTEAEKEIYESIPKRVDLTAILRAAYEQLSNAATADGLVGEPFAIYINAKLAEVLREIATYTVEQFTRRTGQAFQWVDEEPWEPEGQDAVMHFSLDAKGNVVF